MANRIQLISSHIHFPPIPHDPSLKSFFDSQPSLNKQLLQSHYYSVIHHPRKIFQQVIQESPLFNHLNQANYSLQERREISIKQMEFMYQKGKQLGYIFSQDINLNKIILYSLSQYDLGLAVKTLIHCILYTETLKSIGTQSHSEFLKRAINFDDKGCFAMTELGHGTNVAQLQTTASYNHQTKTFTINSPTATSAKWWIGGATTANMCIVFAQLIHKGKNRGVHGFLVPLRNQNKQILPGITIGDLGVKGGINNIDNTCILFENIEIPAKNLLNKFSSVNEQGKFKTKIKNPTKRLSVMLGGLIIGRIGVISCSETNLRRSLTIALRYSVVRKQFGNLQGPQLPILSYQLHQHRLIPLISLMLGSRATVLRTIKILQELIPVHQKNPQSPQWQELHAMVTACKASVSWAVFDGINACRQAVGGFGVSAYSVLTTIRNNHDANLTWEGDNSVLIQQTSRYILQTAQRMMKGKQVIAKSLQFLKLDFQEKTIPTVNTEQEICNHEFLRVVMETRVIKLVQDSVMQLQENVGNSTDVIQAWNSTQVHFIQDLAKAFGELYVLESFYIWIQDLREKSAALADQILKFYYLGGIDIMLKNLQPFYAIGLTNSSAKIIKSTYRKLCKELAEISVSIIDVLAPSDKCLGSMIGKSDGQVYKNIVESVLNFNNK